VIVKICINYVSKEIHLEFIDEKNGKSVEEQSYNDMKAIEIHGITRIFLERVTSDCRIMCIFAETKGKAINKGNMIILE